jgi:hypothetical protein
MDPKMDSGYLEPGETMEDDYDFTKPLLPEEIIGIIDQLICHEVPFTFLFIAKMLTVLQMAWHMGHPLGQTIFTSLYIDRLLDPCPTQIKETYFDRSESAADESLDDQILRAYCLGLVKTCGYVNERVKAEHYYEVIEPFRSRMFVLTRLQEEDFVTHTFNRSLLENIDVDDILGLLQDTIKELSSCKDISENLKLALKARLEYRETFLRTVEAAESRTSMENIKKLWQELGTLLPALRSSANSAQPVSASFSAKLQRKLASTVPPRPIVDLKWDTACDHLEGLCQDGSVAAEVLKYYDSHSLMVSAFHPTVSKA